MQGRFIPPSLLDHIMGSGWGFTLTGALGEENVEKLHRKLYKIEIWTKTFCLHFTMRCGINII